jgi:hypothetical protein
MSTLMALVLFHGLSGATGGGGDSASAGSWRYVTPPLGAPFAHGPMRILPLSAEKPAGLEEKAAYRGQRRRYASLMYGFGKTAPVIIVLDEGPNVLDCYVDVNRDRTITANERLAADTGSWKVNVPAVWQQGNTVEELKRTLLLRYGKVTKSLSVATCGYIEGQVALDGKKITVRRVDGDANGLFGDPQDRLWIDLDNDGKWDSANEEHLLAPFIRLHDRRWVVRGDARGTKLSLTPLEGTGRVHLSLPPNLSPAQVEDIQVTLESRDGVVASIRKLGDEPSLPIGTYRVSALLLTLKAEQGEPWGFVFGGGNGKTEHRWHEVKKDQTTVIDPIVPLEFSLVVADDAKVARPDAPFTVRPALYTGDGLLIEQAYRGVLSRAVYDAGCSARILLVDTAGKTLDTASSGFA